MDSLTDHISLEEFVASVSTSESSNMTMQHLDTMANNGTESASIGMSTPHGGAALGSLSPSSTDTSLDKTTGRVMLLIFFFLKLSRSPFLKYIFSDILISEEEKPTEN